MTTNFLLRLLVTLELLVLPFYKQDGLIIVQANDFDIDNSIGRVDDGEYHKNDNVLSSLYYEYPSQPTLQQQQQIPLEKEEKKGTTNKNSKELLFDCPECPWGRSELGKYPLPYNVAAPTSKSDSNESKLSKKSINNFKTIHRGKYFDIYAPWIETRYSEVYWTAQPSINLPTYIINKFKNKPISITGYEVDVISTSKSSEDGQDEEWSVPEYQVYNHHYVVNILGKDAKMTSVGKRSQDSLLFQKEKQEEILPSSNNNNNNNNNSSSSSSISKKKRRKHRDYRHAIEVHPPEWEPRDIIIDNSDDHGDDDDEQQGLLPTKTIPTAQIFVQGNGGEHRKSFKHLPRGTGQLIMSPEKFVLQPMLINTNFPPKPGQTPREAFYDALLPRNSLSPIGANYSGLLECPCTTRTKKIITGFQTKSHGTCTSKSNSTTGITTSTNDNNNNNDNDDGTQIITNQHECFNAASQLIGDITHNKTVDNINMPSGCFVIAARSGTETYFNTNKETTKECGRKDGVPIRSMGSGTIQNGNGRLGIHLDLDESTGNATITMVGPADVWFAVGFDASAMADTPYTIVVQGGGNHDDEYVVTEQKLGDHMPGTILEPSVHILSNTVQPNIPESIPVKMNHNGKPLGNDVGANSWMSCRDICRTNDMCGAWTFLPMRFTTPYNIEDGTCRLRHQQQQQQQQGDQQSRPSSSTSSTSGFTNIGWMDGMFSGERNVNKKQNIRTVVMTRKLAGITSNHFTFDPSSPSLKYIEAVGTDSTFGYHGPKGRGGDTMVMVEVGAPICICRGPQGSLSGSINGIPWSNNCRPYPATTILRDKNPSCSIETYEGGMICCHHGIFLLDADQQVPAPTFRFRMKFRFYYEDPAEITGQKSIAKKVYPGLDYQNAFFMFRETEVAHGEYDVPRCADGTPPSHCVHTVIGNFQMKQAVRKCNGRADVWCSPVTEPNKEFPQSQYVALVHVSPHCHGPSCISMEMKNADTNETICYTEPHYGDNDSAMNEAGYAAGIPPCLWGDADEGLPFPPILSLDTNITVIKKVNSTFGHRGVMAHWQMRGIWAADPSVVTKSEEENTT